MCAQYYETRPKVKSQGNPKAHSSERRFRGEVVSSAKQHNARITAVIALHPGCASRELVLSLFDHFLTFALLHVKNVRNGLPGSALERPPFQQRFRG
jgi:hypothetical protein